MGYMTFAFFMKMINGSHNNFKKAVDRELLIVDRKGGKLNEKLFAVCDQRSTINDQRIID